MLRQLDKLGVVGTRVLNASTDNIVASLRHLQPTLTKLGDAGDSLASGLSMLASFPFPKEAANIVRGDYANAAVPHGHQPQQDHQVARRGACPNLINLCGALPCAPACEALSPALKATVCAVAPPDVVALLCPPGSKASNQNPLPLPDLGSPPGSGRLLRSSGGLGGLLGGGGG